MKKLLIFFYFVIIFYCFINKNSVGISAELNSSASSVVVLEATTGTILFSKNINQKIYSSSLNQLISLYVIFSELKKNSVTLNTKIKIGKNSEIYNLFPNSTTTIENLIKAITVLYNNKAAVLIAENIYDSEEKFVNSINYYTKQLGLYNTNFTNLKDLSNINNSSTSKDIANLSRKIITDFPEYSYFFNLNGAIFNRQKYKSNNLILSSKDITVNVLNLYNNNNNNYKISFSAKNSQNVQVIGFIDGIKSYSDLIKETKKIIDFTFSNTIVKTIYKKGVLISKVPVFNGSHHSIGLYANSDINIIYNKSIKKLNNYQVVFIHNDVLLPNISKGDIIGNIIIQDKSNPSNSYAYNITSNIEIRKGSFVNRIWAYPYYIIQRLIMKMLYE